MTWKRMCMHLWEKPVVGVPLPTMPSIVPVVVTGPFPNGECAKQCCSDPTTGVKDCTLKGYVKYSKEVGDIDVAGTTCTPTEPTITTTYSYWYGLEADFYGNVIAPAVYFTCPDPALTYCCSFAHSKTPTTFINDYWMSLKSGTTSRSHRETWTFVKFVPMGEI